jgi:hypothetical protein
MKISANQGFLLVTVMIFLFITTALVSVMLLKSGFQYRLGATRMAQQQGLYGLKRGLAEAKAKLHQQTIKAVPKDQPLSEPIWQQYNYRSQQYEVQFIYQEIGLFPCLQLQTHSKKGLILYRILLRSLRDKHHYLTVDEAKAKPISAKCAHIVPITNREWSRQFHDSI